MLNPFFFRALFSALSLLFSISSSTLAATIADESSLIDIHQNNKINQNLRDQQNELIRQREINEINKIQKSKTENSKTYEAAKTNDSKLCKIIENFIFSGNEEFSSSKLKNKFTKKYHNNCLTKNDLNDLRKTIENFYIKKGFVLTRVYFDLRSLAHGSLVIVIEEGKLEKIEIKDNSKLNEKLSFRKSLQKFSAFPFQEKNIFDLHIIEQGLEQINRLSSQNAGMDIEPSDLDGYSKIIINNKISNLTNLNLGTDNSGNKKTGKERYKIWLNQDNLIGLNDNIFLNYTQSGNDDSHYSKSFYSNISIPFGYYTLGASYSFSHYLLTTSGSATTLKSSGNSEYSNYYLERVLARQKYYKISLKGELERNDTNSYLEDTYIPINSRRTTTANLYLTNIFYLRNTTIYLQAKYNKGLKILGAKIDGDNLAKDQPRAQFDSYGLYGQINSNFKIKNFPLNYKLTFDSLSSEDSLYGSDQFNIGNRYTVRGFQESIISGDSGYYVRNDLKTSLNNFFANPLFSKAYIGIFYDYGYVRNKVINEQSDKGYMAGTGVALSYMGKNLAWDLSYAKGLRSPDFLRSVDKIKKEKEIIYFSMNFSFGWL